MSTKPRVYKALQTAAEFTALVDAYIEIGEPFGFDIESGFIGDADLDKIALKTKHPRWVFTGFSLAIDTDSAVYVPIAHDDATVNVDDPVQVARDLWRLLKTGKAVAHNASFELKGGGRWFQEMLGDDPEYGEEVMSDYGIFKVLGDTMLLGFVMDLYYGERLTSKEGKAGEGSQVGKDLKSVIEYLFRHKMIQFKDLFVDMKLKNAGHARFNMLELTQRVITYACEDALWCLTLYKYLIKRREEDIAAGTYNDTAYQIELALLPVVARMDQIGLPLDWEYLRKKLVEAEELKAEMNDEIMEDISNELGELVSFNLASTQQVASILYDRLGIPRPKERGKETNSTAEKALVSLSKSNPIVKSILTYRTVNKMIGSYIKKYLTDLDYRGDGRAYPSHNATGAISGRFSVDGMSYQQLPKPYHYTLKNGREFHLAFREIIKAPEGSRLVGFDYSQIQLRLMAGFAQEKAMISAFNRGTDIHIATASSMLNVPEDKITDKQRSVGKALANSELVLTPSGWIPMGDIKVGDLVVEPTGGTAKVSHFYPQGFRKIFKVEFEDGTIVRADGDHRWAVKDIRHHKSIILTTNELLEAGLVYQPGQNSPTWKWYVENVAPLEFDGPSDLSIDPYVLGILLGDGGLSGPAVRFSVGASDKEETLGNVTSRIQNTGVQLRAVSDVDYVLSSSIPGAYRNSIDRELKSLGLRGSKTKFYGRFGCRSWEKFVPQEYLYAGIEQRYEVLRGIMDADGTVGDDGRALLTTTSKQLAEDVMFLARSLGGRSKIMRTRNTTFTYKEEKKTGRLSYEVLISTPENPFKLQRKANKWARINYTKTARLQDKKIISITEDGWEEASCITVDSPEHEFITAGVTRTKNTINFAQVFQQGADALAASLGMTIPEAEAAQKKYYAGFPDLRGWMDHVQEQAGKKAYVYGLFGRRYQIWEFFSNLGGVRSKGDRTAINEPIQGAEAIYAKLAMVRADKAIRAAGLQDKIKLVIMIHDALEFFVDDSISTQEVIDLLDSEVSYPIPGDLKFPEITADWHEGPNLGSLVEIELDENKQITGYSMKMEVSGEPAVKWGAPTFNEVFDQYKDWRVNDHPEYREKVAVKPEVEEDNSPAKTFELQVTEQLTPDKLKRAIEFMEDIPGNNTVTLISGNKSAKLPITAGITLKHQINFNIIFGKSHLYEVTEGEELPF